jgi:hypothetical protein
MGSTRGIKCRGGFNATRLIVHKREIHTMINPYNTVINKRGLCMLLIVKSRNIDQMQVKIGTDILSAGRWASTASCSSAPFLLSIC